MELKDIPTPSPTIARPASNVPQSFDIAISSAPTVLIMNKKKKQTTKFEVKDG
jgi:hypothetical protein